MKLGFLSPQTTATPNDRLLDLLSELIDAHADTVQLITSDQRTELECSAHCDYLRALQRHGHETLAHHDHPHTPAAPPAVSALNTAISTGWTAGLLLLLYVPARAMHAVGMRGAEPPTASTV